MNRGWIHNIDITTNNQDVITISSNNFENLYVANLDDNGDEKAYEIDDDTSSLIANFFMIKILKNDNPETYLAMERLTSRKDIIKIKINFNNGKYQEFNLAKNRVLKDGLLENLCESLITDNDNLCIVVSDKKIRYMKCLFE